MTPKSALSVTPLCANSGWSSCRRGSRPPHGAARRRRASAAGTRSAKRTAPRVVRMPAVSSVSFTEKGTPWSRPSGSPRITASSARRAATRASSAVTVAKAFRGGSTLSIAQDGVDDLDRGELLARDRRASRAAGHAHSSIRLPPSPGGASLPIFGGRSETCQGVAGRPTQRVPPGVYPAQGLHYCVDASESIAQGGAGMRRFAWILAVCGLVGSALLVHAQGGKDTLTVDLPGEPRRSIRTCNGTPTATTSTATSSTTWSPANRRQDRAADRDRLALRDDTAIGSTSAPTSSSTTARR